MKNKPFKQILSVLLLIFCCNSAYSQKYQKMLGDSNLWSDYHFSWGNSWNSVYKASKPLMIHSKQYKKFTFDSYDWGYIREDTLKKKIYFLEDTTFSEKVLYDFSLNIGDTFIYKDSLNYRTIHFLVSQIDSTKPRQISLKNLDSTNSVYLIDSIVWIEGVGCNMSFLYPDQIFDYDNFSYLACAYRDTLKTYLNPYGYPCYSTPVGIENNAKSSPSITISPNPYSGNYTLNISENFTGEVLIYDMLGNVKYHENIQGKNKFDISLIAPSGIYFLKANSNDGNTSTLKLVKY